MNENDHATHNETTDGGPPTDLAPSCKAAARLMSEARDRVLSHREAQSLQAHLAICRNCTRYNAQLDFLSELSRRYADMTTTALKKAPPEGDED
jgi:Putative zinc-finger